MWRVLPFLEEEQDHNPSAHRALAREWLPIADGEAAEPVSEEDAAKTSVEHCSRTSSTSRRVGLKPIPAIHVDQRPALMARLATRRTLIGMGYGYVHQAIPA